MKASVPENCALGTQFRRRKIQLSRDANASTAMRDFSISQLAVPAVSALITFLSYSSQYLFRHIDPGPLSKSQSIKFNVLVAFIWICYARACATNPGRVPADWKPVQDLDADLDGGLVEDGSVEAVRKRQRWCRRCEVLKPPRAHHCKTCQR